MKRWLVLGLIWQLIKMYLFKQITISQVTMKIKISQDQDDDADNDYADDDDAHDNYADNDDDVKDNQI